MRFVTTMSSSEDSQAGVEGGANDIVSAGASNAPPVVTNGTINDSMGGGAHSHHHHHHAHGHGYGHGGKDLSGGDKPEDDFSDYLWMENMEEYDQEIMRQLEEDILISHYTDLYEDSLLEDGSAGPTTASLCVVNGPIIPSFGDSTGDDLADVTRQFHRSVNLNSSSSGSSRLNPNAAEFVPKGFGNISYQH